MTLETNPSNQVMKIGLETHVTLNTKSKLFCGCSTQTATVPNEHTCVTCLGLPGSKPRLNQRAVELGVQAATALGMQIRATSRFARKTYYYPDLSKNYQITQYDEPLAENGHLQVGQSRVELSRLHIEEDPAQIVYPHGNMVRSTYVLLDYNRSGMPLLEIVTTPCLKNPQEAKNYLEALFRRLAYLNVIDAKAERVMKTDANISIPGGERVEIKNITSFAAVERALQAEYFRQRRMQQEGKPIERQTRLYSEETNTTLLMRTKEQEEDYGYIVEPDLPPLALSSLFLQTQQSAMRELPEKAIARLQAQMPQQYAEILVFANLVPYLESSRFADRALAAKWLCGDFLKCMNYQGMSDPTAAMAVTEFDQLLAAVSVQAVTERAAKEYIKKMVGEKKTWKQVLAEEINSATAGSAESLIEKILQSQGKAVEEYRAGKPKALEFLVGEFLKQHRGVHPNEVRKLLEEKIRKTD